jgi:hypothetical protein
MLAVKITSEGDKREPAKFDREGHEQLCIARDFDHRRRIGH